MAEEKKAEAAPAKGDAPKKGGKLGLYTAFVIVGAAFPFIMPTMVLLLFGMIPTIIALVTDTERSRSSAAAIGFMNAAGVTPFILDLWAGGQTMQGVFQILREPSSWVVMLGAAGIGQLILFAVPQAMATLSLARSESRLKVLKENLEQLKTVWGPDVATTKPLDKIGKSE